MGQGNSYQSTRLDGWLIASSPRYRSGLRSKAGASQSGHLESPEAVVCRKQTVAPKGQLCESSQLCFLDITLAVWNQSLREYLHLRNWDTLKWGLFLTPAPPPTQCWLLSIYQNTTTPREEETTCDWVLDCLSTRARVLVSFEVYLQARVLSSEPVPWTWCVASLCSTSSRVHSPSHWILKQLCHRQLLFPAIFWLKKKNNSTHFPHNYSLLL